MSDPVLSTLGLALRSGNLAVGETPAADACRAGKARLVLLSSDAAENTARRAGRLAEQSGCALAALPYDKTQVGHALGRGVCALAAVTDKGFAESIRKKLAAIETN